ncbi:MAG: Holliday junction resolvase [Treponema sp.]|nr:Holliday junction resolvase [Treponema sp.]
MIRVHVAPAKNINNAVEDKFQTLIFFLEQLSKTQLIFFAVIFAFCVLLLFLIFYSLGRKVGKLEVLKKQDKLLKTERADAVKRSRAVISGQLCEQIAPFLPDFPCSPDDVRFIGKPVDFIGFVGLANDIVEEILFIEVKTGESKLSSREKSIKEAVMAKKVRYVEYYKN